MTANPLLNRALVAAQRQGLGVRRRFENGWTVDCPQCGGQGRVLVKVGSDGLLDVKCVGSATGSDRRPCDAPDLLWRSLDLSPRDIASAPVPLGEAWHDGDAHASALLGTKGALTSVWPAPLGSAALHGPAGEFVRLIEPQSEADPAALLFQFLVGFGSITGRGPHARAEADEHHGILFVVLVGRSAKGRKGSSWSHARRALEYVDSSWSSERQQSGLSSGEGLIHAVRDGDGGHAVAVADKRLLAYEAEFASVLRVLQREGNTLSALLRAAWDGAPLRTLTKNSPASATGAHISIIAHSTRDEVLRYMDRTELANGFANRFLWICVGRSKELPFGGKVPQEQLQSLAERVRECVERARHVGEVVFSDEARVTWGRAYHRLSAERAGMLGAVTGRAEAQVLRLALLYALLDGENVIQVVHLEAALECWRYADESARAIFGDSTGNADADRILAALSAEPAGLDRTAISGLFNKSVPKERIDQALGRLAEFGLAQRERVRTGGRDREVWRATKFPKEPKEPATGHGSAPLPSDISALSYSTEGRDEFSAMLPPPSPPGPAPAGNRPLNGIDTPSVTSPTGDVAEVPPEIEDAAAASYDGRGHSRSASDV